MCLVHSVKTVDWKACVAVRVMQTEVKTDGKRLQTDGQTWAQLFTGADTMFTVKYMRENIANSLAFVNEAWDMETDRDSYELSWAHVHKPESERCFTV